MHEFHISVPPMMWVPEQQLSALRFDSVTLKCFVEAHPEALTYWEHRGRMVQAGTRFVTIVTHGTPSYKVPKPNDFLSAKLGILFINI